MADEGFKRKLTAILCADAVGYSRLMREDEEATVRDIAAHRVLITEIIQQHHGRVIDSPGDNILAEFASVVDAVNGAIKIQEKIKKSNANTPKDRRMEFRIGINLGDVIEEEDRIYGDGVNIAARVEGLASAGGISISGTVYEHIKDKLSLGYHYLGEQDVKNIPEPVRVYRLLTEPEDAGKMTGAEKTTSKRGLLWAVSAVVMVAIVTFGVWQFYLRRPKIEPASVEKMAFPLPDKPSIAVLAFDNLSGDPEQEYFSDGIAENIITALSKVGELFVIARNSSFTYKGKPVKVQNVSRELGVRYVLEGSVQKSGDRVRITAQLIDAKNGQHIWAENYDHDFKNIFEIQDDIALKIVTALQVHLTAGEQARVWSKETQDLDVYLKSIQAYSLMREGKKESLIRYGQLAQEIADMAPESPLGYRMLAWYHYDRYMEDRSRTESYLKAYDMVQKALSLNVSDAYSHALFGWLYRAGKRWDKAIESGMRSVELEPNGAYLHCLLGNTLIYACRFDEALVHLKQAIRLNPFPAYFYYQYLGMCYFHKGQPQKALSEYEKALQLSSTDPYLHGNLAVTYISLGREEEARASREKSIELAPQSSVGFVTKNWPFKCRDNLQLFLDAMRKAGFPE